MLRVFAKIEIANASVDSLTDTTVPCTHVPYCARHAGRSRQLAVKFDIVPTLKRNAAFINGQRACAFSLRYAPHCFQEQRVAPVNAPSHSTRSSKLLSWLTLRASIKGCHSYRKPHDASGGAIFWSDNAGGRKIVIRDIPTATEPVAQVNMMMNLGYIVKAKEIAALSAAVLAKFGPIPPAQHPMPVTAAMTRDDLLWTRSTNSTMK